MALAIIFAFGISCRSIFSILYVLSPLMKLIPQVAVAQVGSRYLVVICRSGWTEVWGERLLGVISLIHYIIYRMFISTAYKILTRSPYYGAVEHIAI